MFYIHKPQKTRVNSKPNLCQRKIQALFSAIFFAQDTFALQLINNDENILFDRKTFKVR